MIPRYALFRFHSHKSDITACPAAQLSFTSCACWFSTGNLKRRGVEPWLGSPCPTAPPRHGVVTRRALACPPPHTSPHHRPPGHFVTPLKHRAAYLTSLFGDINFSYLTAVESWFECWCGKLLKIQGFHPGNMVSVCSWINM